jgi:hypothetical protein
LKDVVEQGGSLPKEMSMTTRLATEDLIERTGSEGAESEGDILLHECWQGFFTMKEGNSYLEREYHV